MKTTKLLLPILSLALFCSCVKDNTTELTDDFNKYSITGVEASYTALVGEPFSIHPEVTIDHIKNEGDIQYFWIMSDNRGLVKDTVARTKNLDITLSGKFGESISCSFHALDTKRDIRYKTYTVIRTTSNFQKGWVVLSDKGNDGYLSFISAANGKVYADLYGNIFNKPMPKGKYVDIKGFENPGNTGVSVILEDKPEESFFLDGKSLAYNRKLSDLFFTMDYVKGPFAPKNISLDPTCAMYSNMFVLTNGKIYVKPRSMTINVSFFGAPIGGDYQTDEFFGICGESGESFVTYDYKNKRYIFVVSDDLLSVRTLSTPIQNGFDFDMSNIDVTPVWMGWSAPYPYGTDSFVSIVKNNATGKYQLHLIYIKREKVDGIYGYYAKRVKKLDLPENVFTANSKVCTSANVMYVSNDKTIYRLNLDSFSTMDVIKTMDETITCLEYATDGSIAVATNSGSGELPGNLYVISTLTDNLGSVLMEKKAVGGVIKDLVYKFY